jgi:hypothetical protein
MNISELYFGRVGIDANCNSASFDTLVELLCPQITSSQIQMKRFRQCFQDLLCNRVKQKKKKKKEKRREEENTLAQTSKNITTSNTATNISTNIAKPQGIFFFCCNAQPKWSWFTLRSSAPRELPSSPPPSPEVPATFIALSPRPFTFNQAK